MALKKITDEDLAGKGVMPLSDVPGLSAENMKYKFEQILRELVIPYFNDNMDEIASKIYVDPGTGTPYLSVADLLLTYDRVKQATELDNGKMPNAVAVKDMDLALKALIQAATDAAIGREGTLDGKITLANAAITKMTNELLETQYLGALLIKGVYGVLVEYTEPAEGSYPNYSSKCTRLADAVGRTGGVYSDWYGPFRRKKCIVGNSGQVACYKGQTGYTETGKLTQNVGIYHTGDPVQVMIEQPKFYYKVVPFNSSKKGNGVIGKDVTKCAYFVSASYRPGFKLHPAFINKNGKEVATNLGYAPHSESGGDNYPIYIGAYEASMYDASATDYWTSVDTAPTIATGDLLCSVGGQKPVAKISSDDMETIAQNRGTGWHLQTIQAAMIDPLLFMIEYASVDCQATIGMGAVSLTTQASKNCTLLTGSTDDDDNKIGTSVATSSTQTDGDGSHTETGEGHTSLRYRFKENPWGNIGEKAAGANVYGDGTQFGGQLYVCADAAYDIEKHTGNYEATGMTLPNRSEAKAMCMCYDEKYDWLFVPALDSMTNVGMVRDYVGVSGSLNGYATLTLGGSLSYGDYAGLFCTVANAVVSNTEYTDYNSGGRLMYVPE